MARTRGAIWAWLSPLLVAVSLLLLPAAMAGDSESPIKKVVVLVLENRSFDHILGWMKRSVNPAIDGLTGSECNRVSSGDPSSPPVCVTDDAHFVVSDPPHSFEAVQQQIFGSGAGAGEPSMSGFVQSATAVSPSLARGVMSGFPPEKLPVFAALARDFAVFDRWFSSMPGPTQPNRLFLFSATSAGATAHVKEELARGYPQRTIFDSLHADGLDFGVYAESLPCALFLRSLRRLRYAGKFHRFAAFKEHARRGRLRSLSVVEPRYFDIAGAPADDDHPSHDVANGQRLVKEVYEALRAGPQWNQTLLVVTYDEHGGFFDHVPTPATGVPSPDAARGPPPARFAFDRLGVRVPALMASPWIKKGTVVARANGPTASSEYEHSSIPATLKKLFNLSSPFLTRRDAWAGTFEHVVGELTSPRTDCIEVLPEVAPLRGTGAEEEAELSELQSELVQLAADLQGDEAVSRLVAESSGRMTVRQASEYVDDAMAGFLRAGREALRMGLEDSTEVDVWSGLASRTRFQ
ncbi:unnamed protein product [Spirodela intermedia]|uniref:Uncharacterized protein n=1 Tax=Spirodela intermedia TaxID=51605 RepID=A0A7I8KSE7_SPIIN|nr:unnamed protein product [Spirodela intermedia]